MCGKKLLAVLLAAAMMVTMPEMPVSATEAESLVPVVETDASAEEGGAISENSDDSESEGGTEESVHPEEDGAEESAHPEEDGSEAPENPEDAADDDEAAEAPESLSANDLGTMTVR